MRFKAPINVLSTKTYIPVTLYFPVNRSNYDFDVNVVIWRIDVSEFGGSVKAFLDTKANQKKLLKFLKLSFLL
ncbi:hypothetical protein L596_007950 [Steinernema carpocapsae]|uniref:Uncharacterized protein n=1 Tax=Steinernema carpocapsae TaxID=34508 RepID=A0A4U5PAY9_STECR|nr:hypothetical protein L596_007950 [Steinernema carpocapsae]